MLNLKNMHKQQAFRARAPLRLGLAGGGTDVSPFSDEMGGYVLNATIDLYAHAILEPTTDNKIVFVADDLELYFEEVSSEILDDIEPLRLHRGIYNAIVKKFNKSLPLSFKLTTYSDAPAGSGLGTSSTLVVCIIQCFSEWLGLGLGEYEIAQLAYQIERVELKLKGGKQDQYAAAFGGFNFMEFGPGESRVLVNPLRVKSSIKNELEASIVLFYSGQSRDSSKIIEKQIVNFESRNSSTIDAMSHLKENALRIKEALLRGDLNSFAILLGKSWDSKKRLAENVSNSFLDQVYSDVIKAGAISGKISGAGGGGFFIFFVSPQNRMKVIRTLKKINGEVINFHFTDVGSQSWLQNSNSI
jgi:D-glycero-alpha-D-manno-heptose-7-phosphate kinase